MLSFTAQAQDSVTLLQWTTSIEINNKGFHVERSIDSVNWVDLAFINSLTADGNSSELLNYQFIAPHAGTSRYKLLLF
jgi:hypothetical protein